MKGFSLSMLPFETDTVLREVTKNCHRVMPRVVSDQQSKFDSDELFRKLSREGEIKYTGFKDRPAEERQLRFQTECREGHADLAFVNTGINLQLQFTTNAWSENPDDRVPTTDFVNFDREPGKVHLKSQFILNGVCVIWKGWIDLNRLDGIGAIEFDRERAMEEDHLLRQHLDAYQRSVQDFDDRQRHYRQEQERRAAAEAEEYHRILRSRVEMLEKTHPLYMLGLNRRKRDSSSSSSTASKSHDAGTKKLKKSESTVQIPVPVKPVAVSSGLRSLMGPNLAIAAAADFHRPHLPFSAHTAGSSAMLGPGLHVSDSLTSRASIATRNPLVTSCPVKLYPWKPNMYLV